LIERAILLKDTISLNQGNTRAPIDLRGELTGSDWLELSELSALLESIYKTSLYVQPTPDHWYQRHGALHEVLTTMDFILTHLGRAKDSSTYTDAVLYKTAVNLGWMKLN
jgi:hypothetical protein